ncbi:MAG: hypothetical protein OEV44_07305 [Spirochaetota bacterium]|nr:hypothetical protein [Spirochaetota bacterium]
MKNSVLYANSYSRLINDTHNYFKESTFPELISNQNIENTPVLDENPSFSIKPIVSIEKIQIINNDLKTATFSNSSNSDEKKSLRGKNIFQVDKLDIRDFFNQMAFKHTILSISKKNIERRVGSFYKFNCNMNILDYSAMHNYIVISIDYDTIIMNCNNAQIIQNNLVKKSYSYNTAKSKNHNVNFLELCFENTKFTGIFYDTLFLNIIA